MGPRALWLACDGSASLMARVCLNNRRHRMQAIGPAHQAQNHRNCRKTENGSQQFSCRVYLTPDSAHRPPLTAIAKRLDALYVGAPISVRSVYVGCS
jgi:hypothetical protein